MTFRDNFTHLGLILFLTTGCWAPEVAPTTPKKSPAEIASLAISSAEASTTVRSMVPPQELYSKEINPPSQTEQTSEAPQQDAIVNYPFQAMLSGSTATLLGHGGGAILTLEAELLPQAQIKVLERKDELYRVICQNCTAKHPFQAGWILYSELRAID